MIAVALAVTYAPLMPPIALLGVVLAVGGTAIALRRHARRRRVAWLTAVAREHRMTFSPTDRFDLTRRLAALPEWTTQAIDLVITDVLYATDRSTRRFVATATYRRTHDERPHRFVFACAERLPANDLDLASIRTADRSGAGEGQYRDVLSSPHAVANG